MIADAALYFHEQQLDGLTFFQRSDALRYRTYAAAVRDEYADVPDEVFKPARAQVLSALLDRSLFHTSAGRERWEETARRNIAEEIAALAG